MNLHGWYLNVDSETYHGGEGISKTDLALLLRSPAHFKTPPEEPTPAMIQGEAFHLYTLQPELFDKRFAIMPQGQDGRTKEGKACTAEAEAKGKQVISSDIFENIKGMRGAIWAHPKIAEILSEGQAEVSGYWNDLRYPEILCKIRPDWLYTSQNHILDLKSTENAEEGAFMRVADSKHYHLQAGWYTYGAEMITGVEHSFAFAAVERDPPYGVIYYPAGDDTIQDGRIEAQRALEIYHRCLETNTWPCYTTEPVVLHRPPWKKKRDMILD